MAQQTSLGILAANFDAAEDVTSELANEAIDRMTATDEAAAEVDHADYDPVAALGGGTGGNAVTRA